MKQALRAMKMLSIALLLCIAGCTKKATIEVDNETQSTVDNAIVDQEFMVMVPAIHTTYKRAFGYYSASSHCDSLIKQSGDTLYGTSGHVDPIYTMNMNACNYTLQDGRTRSGKLWIRFTGSLRNNNSTMIIKLQDYRSDGVSYSCDSIIATVLSVTGNRTTFHVKLINGICQSSTFTIKNNYDRTFVNDLSDGYDPYVSVFGTSSGINRDNRAFSVVIPQASPLVKHRSCRFIDQGILEITPDGFKTREVNFGNGNCDDDATFSVNGNTLAFKLK